MHFPFTRHLLVLFLFMTMTTSTFAASLPEKIQQTYSQIHALEGTFTQTLLHRESASTTVRKGHLFFEKPLLVRWEVQGSSPELLVIGADALWNYFPDEELAYRYPLEMVNDSRSIIQIITGQSKLTEDFYVVEQGVENNTIKLQLYPKEPVPHFTEATLWIDAQTNHIVRCMIYDFYGNENNIQFDNLLVNPTIAPDLFVFTPPKGTDVEDRTQQEVPEQQLFQ